MNAQLSASLNWAFARLSETSTWRGIIAVATGAGIAISPDLAAQITAAGLGIIGVINIIRKEDGVKS